MADIGRAALLLLKQNVDAVRPLRSGRLSRRFRRVVQDFLRQEHVPARDRQDERQRRVAGAQLKAESEGG